MQGSSLCNRRFICLNADNIPLKKYKYTSVNGSLNAFSNLLNLFTLPHSDSTSLELVADFGVSSKKKLPLNWNIATKFFQQPFPNSVNAYLCVLRYHDTPHHKILHSFVLYFCQNSKKYRC